MKAPQDIILKPVITEKTAMESTNGRYTFVVAKGSTKPEIRQAVEALFSVKVLQVNTMNYTGKSKRMGVHQGKRADWKKAVVQIDLDPTDTSYQTAGGKSASVSKKYKTSIEEFGFIQ